MDLKYLHGEGLRAGERGQAGLSSAFAELDSGFTRPADYQGSWERVERLEVAGLPQGC